MKLDHLGIAVANVDDALSVYRALGFVELDRGQVADFNVEVCMLDAGHAKLELLAPLGPGAIQKFLEKRGPGLHHMAFSVPDIEAELARLKTQGVRLVDAVSRPGFGGHLVAFLHPQSANGALIELVQSLDAQEV